MSASGGVALAAGSVCALLLSASCAGAELPEWELGLGPTGLVVPDYRGSNQYRGYVYPFPYVVYRGDRFRIERDRIREFLLNNDRLELDVSLGGSVPVDSSRDNARQGMPNLDPVFESGPALKYVIDRTADGDRELSVAMAARAALASNFSRYHFVGWTFQPSVGIDWRHVTLAGSHDWNTGILASTLINTRRYDQYYYEVDQQYSNASRPAYTAPGGPAGAQLTFSLSKRFQKFWAGGFLRFDTVAGARFEESPLVKTRDGVLAGFAVAWVFDQSSRMVDAAE